MKRVLIIAYIAVFHIHTQEVPLFNCYEYANQCDKDHQVLVSNITYRSHADWWRQAMPFFKQLWSVDYVAKTMKFNSQCMVDNKKASWVSFVAWYTCYMRSLVSDIYTKFKRSEKWDMPFGRAARDNNIGLLRTLCKLGFTYDASLYEGENNPLFQARSKRMMQALLAHGASLTDLDFCDMTPLENAAYEHRISASAIKVLLDCQPIINRKTCRALHKLCARASDYVICSRQDRFLKKIKLLLQAGIDNTDAIEIVKGTLLDFLLDARKDARSGIKRQLKEKAEGARAYLLQVYQEELSLIKKAIILLEEKESHSWRYIDNDLHDMKSVYINPEYRKQELARHRQDIAAMRYVLKTSKTRSQNHEIIKTFADWYEDYLNRVLQTVNLDYFEPLQQGIRDFFGSRI